MRARLGDDSTYCDFEALDIHAKGDNYFFGAATSAYPMLKRSSTAVQIRLADDSDYGDIDAGQYRSGGSGGATGSFTGINTVTVTGGIITNIA